MKPELQENKPSFVYVTYRFEQPTKLWEASSPKARFSEKYWFGYRMETDWKNGGEFREGACPGWQPR